MEWSVILIAPAKPKSQGKGEKILDLPSGGHYTRNLIADRAGRKIYIAIGSASNVDEDNAWEKDQRRAGIVEINPDGSGARIFANGLRNPVGMDWEPQTNVLWTVVNERDLLGDDLVPDYLTSVKEGAFYGWPFSYFGQNEDPRKKGQRPDLVAKAIKPDYAVGSHVAALGARFLSRQSFSPALSGRRLHRHARFVEPLQDGGIIKLPLFPSKTASRPARWKIFSPDSSPTRVNSKPMAARWA